MAMVAGAGNVKNNTTPTRIESGKIPSRATALIRARADRLARRLGNVDVEGAGAAWCAAGGIGTSFGLVVVVVSREPPIGETLPSTKGRAVSPRSSSSKGCEVSEL